MTVIPVRWCPKQQAVVHAETCFREDIALFNGPIFDFDSREGIPIDRDEVIAGEERWLFVPEAPHLGSHDVRYPSMHTAFLVGYARRHGLKISFILHDIMMISHFGREESDDSDALKCIIYANSMADADLVMPVSRSTKYDLNTWFGRVGVNARNACQIKDELLPEEMVGVPCRAFLDTSSDTDVIEFCMWGSLHRHKNQAAALEAFNAVCRRRPDLSLKMHVFGTIDASIALKIDREVRRSEGRIKLHGFIRDDAMTDIISRCRASVFVSLFEGYGLPVAESLWMGKPCLTSNIMPMSEIAYGGGCLMVAPDSIMAISDGIEQLASDDALVDRLKMEIRERKMRTWDEYTHALLKNMREYKTENTYIPPEVHMPLKAVASPGTNVVPASHMILSKDYADINAVYIENGILYFRADKGPDVSEEIICRTDRLPVTAGTYEFVFDGEMTGEVPVKIKVYGEKFDFVFEKTIDSEDKSKTIDFHENEIAVELLFLRSSSLEDLTMRSVSMTKIY